MEKFSPCRGRSCGQPSPPYASAPHSQSSAHAPLHLAIRKHTLCKLALRASSPKGLLHNVAFASVCGSGSPTACPHSPPVKNTPIRRFFTLRGRGQTFGSLRGSVRFALWESYAYAPGGEGSGGILLTGWGAPHSRGVCNVSRETPRGVSCTLGRALCPRWGQIPDPFGAGGKKRTKPPNTKRRHRPPAVPLWAKGPGVASNVNKNLLSE